MRYYLFILSFVVTFITFSQEEQSKKKDLKVGLVMSGGGAKGFAHIGALKVLEKAGVRIDYIGGTSMGAIVGSLYASGYNATEIDSIFRSYDFDELMQDNLPRRVKSMYQKENTEKYALSLPIKNGSIGLPKALSKGQNVFNELSKLTEHVHSIDDFSKLPIPFFCIATNLETGNQEILEEGFLPEAIKASGSFPTLLNPVEIDKKIMVDGGVVNNFPTDIMRKKGVDIVIGIDVQGKLLTKNEITSAPDVLMQIVNFQMYEDEQKKKGLTDYYVHPEVSDYTVISFDDIQDIVKSGEAATFKQFQAFKKLASQQINREPVKAPIRFKRDSLEIKNIIVKGTKNYTNSYVKGKLGYKKNVPFTYEDFSIGLNQLAATKNFKSIQYKFLKDKTVEFTLDEADVSSFLNINIHYDDLFKTSTLVNLTSSHLIFKNDVLSADLILGDNVRYNLNYFIDNGFHWSYGINSQFNRFEKGILKSTFTSLEDGEVDSRERVEYNDFTNQFFVQTAISNSFAIRYGIESKYLRVFNENFIDNQNFKNFHDNKTYGNAFAEIKLDNYDKGMFPKNGVYLNINYKGYLFELHDGDIDAKFTPFTQLKGKLGVAYTLWDKFTGHLISEAGITIGENSNKVHNFHLGGNNENFINNFTPFYGYDVGDLSGQGYLKSALTARYEVFNKNYVSFTANAARATQDIFNQGALFENTKLGYAVGYSIASFLGPIEAKYTWSPETGLNYWFFNVGFWF